MMHMIFHFIKNTFFLVLSFLGLVAMMGSCQKTQIVPMEEGGLPRLKGKLVYHRYSSYGANDSQMYLFDFATRELRMISKDWNIRNPMNAHFSPDGKEITFMGVGNDTNTWDIFLYDLTRVAAPINLTATGNTRDEDPKFSPDGKRIVFKQDFRVAEMDLSTRTVQVLSPSDYSMPYYNIAGTKLLCSKGDGATSSIEVIDLKTRRITPLYDRPEVQDYYPINVDASSFYYSVGYSKHNAIDQVYRGFWDGRRSERLPFNDLDGNDSDAYPVNSEWVLLSSTRTGSMGGYDLYIAHVSTGKIFSLNAYNTQINTSKEELGAAVFVVSD